MPSMHEDSSSGSGLWVVLVLGALAVVVLLLAPALLTDSGSNMQPPYEVRVVGSRAAPPVVTGTPTIGRNFRDHADLLGFCTDEIGTDPLETERALDTRALGREYTGGYVVLATDARIARAWSPNDEVRILGQRLRISVHDDTVGLRVPDFVVRGEPWLLPGKQTSGFDREPGSGSYLARCPNPGPWIEVLLEEPGGVVWVFGFKTHYVDPSSDCRGV